MRPILILGGIILALVIGKLFIFSSPNDEKGGEGKENTAKTGAPKSGGAIPVEVYLAKMERVENILYASGTVVPNGEVNLKAEIAGRLIKLNLREGASMAKGQLIALALGSAGRSRMSMGTVIMGGLLLSLILTLYVIPAMYAFLSRPKNFERMRDIERIAQESEAPELA